MRPRHGIVLASCTVCLFLVAGCGGGGGDLQPIGPKKEQHGRYTIVWLAGTPYEMGVQHGQLLHDDIAAAMEFVENDLIMASIPRIARNLGLIDLAEANSYPEMLEECQGIVDAAGDTGFSMDYCLVLNFGDVIMERLPLKRKGVEPAGPGCTEVLASGPATPDGRLYHARNLDWGSMDISVIHQHPVIFVRQPTGGIPHVFVGFPLNLSPYTGMNLEGLTVCSNEIDPVGESEQADTGRSHVQMLSRVLSTAGSLAEAREFFSGEAHMSAELIAVADGRSQDASVFEMTGAHFHERRLGSNGLLWAVNHFTSAEMDPYDLPQDIDNPDSSIMRAERLMQLVEPDGADSVYGQLDLDGLAGVMRDRVNPRTGIEPPYDEENVDNDAGIATNGPMHFVLFDPERLMFWVAAGKVPIDRQPYVGFSLPALLGISGAEPVEPAEL